MLETEVANRVRLCVCVWVCVCVCVVRLVCGLGNLLMIWLVLLLPHNMLPYSVCCRDDICKMSVLLLTSLEVVDTITSLIDLSTSRGSSTL